MRISRRSLMLGTVAAAVVVACAEQGTTNPGLLVPAEPSRSVSSLAGQLVINEFMADPNAVTDANGEWIEIYNRGAAAVNLQSFQLASANAPVPPITRRLTVPPGGYVVPSRQPPTPPHGVTTGA